MALKDRVPESRWRVAKSSRSSSNVISTERRGSPSTIISLTICSSVLMFPTCL